MIFLLLFVVMISAFVYSIKIFFEAWDFRRSNRRMFFTGLFLSSVQFMIGIATLLWAINLSFSSRVHPLPNVTQEQAANTVEK